MYQIALEQDQYTSALTNEQQEVKAKRSHLLLTWNVKTDINVYIFTKNVN